MTMPFYVAPEQVMKDRADYARKGIARGRSAVAVLYTDGILIAAENSSATLHKVSEIYDRIAFAGVGKYNEFDQLRIAGVRHADLKGYQYSREDVDARSLANAYAQMLGQIFTHEMKPMEVEILVAEVGLDAAQDQVFHILYDGSVVDEDRYSVIGGDAEAIGDRLEAAYQPGLDLAGALRAAVGALAGPDRSLAPGELEVAVLSRRNGRRTFRRIEDAELAELLLHRLTRGAASRPTGVRLLAMDRRIFGLENEYGVTCTLRGQRRLSPDEVARYLFRRVVSWGRSSNVFLANGARLYLDVGSHPEYATPECDSILDLVTHDKAGERILEQLLGSAEQRLREEGIRGVIYLFKNNTDSAGNSYGCHENYLTSRRDDFGHYAEVLIPFFVSRQIYAGAGKVLQTARGAMFCIAQRAEHIWEGVSSATTRSRPIINTRDEPHADAERYRRLHVIVGDSNMSEYATFLKVGATSILLRMLEDPSQVLRDLTLENPIRAIREISHDTTCRRKVRLANGRELSALDIQSEYLSKALKYAETKDLSPQEKQALQMWEHCVTTIEDDPMKLDRECDWVIKHKLIEGYRAKHDLPLTHPKVALIDLQYHDISRPRGLFYKLQDAGLVERTCTDADIDEAVETPPQTTRARLRGEFIRRAKERKRDYTVDWVHLKLNDQAQRTVLCKDPFRSRDERVEKLIASL